MGVTCAKASSSSSPTPVRAFHPNDNTDKQRHRHTEGGREDVDLQQRPSSPGRPGDVTVSLGTRRVSTGTCGRTVRTKMGSLEPRKENSNNVSTPPSLSDKEGTRRTTSGHIPSSPTSESVRRLWATSRPLSTSQLQYTSRIRFGDMRLCYKVEDRILGTGFNGPVGLVTHRQSGKQYAIKTFHISNVSQARLQMMRNEAVVYLKLDHPNIVRLIELWEDSERAIMVMELCTGGELYDRLAECKLYRESVAREVSSHMLKAIQYLHAHGIVHRDLKLENWLYDSPDDSSLLKLIDFGFSRFWSATRGSSMRATCGTLAYVSPDTLRGDYTNSCDMWSIGVIVYMLLVGYPPFFGSDGQIAADVLEGNYSLTGPRWHRVSHMAKNFVSRLLTVNSNKRMSALEALEHPWFRDMEVSSMCGLPPEVLAGMRQFAQASNLKRAALTMMAYSLTSEEIKGMHAIFLSIDKTREGTLRLSELADAINAHYEISNTEIQQIFSSMDSSGDDQIYYTDFLAAMLLTKLRMHEALIRATFDKFDVDSTGYITLENLKDVLGDNDESRVLQQTLQEVDQDGNGRIDYNEFISAVLTSVEVPAGGRMVDEEHNDGDRTPRYEPEGGMTSSNFGMCARVALGTVVDRQRPNDAWDECSRPMNSEKSKLRRAHTSSLT